jgi:glycosyltransferase involved in cell wall biosynthesis
MVEFIDEVASVGPLLQQADVLALCSVLPEPFGTVVVQALASGVYVLATEPGGAVEILTGSQAGEVLPMSDPRALGDALARLAADHALLGQASSRGRAGCGALRRRVDGRAPNRRAHVAGLIRCDCYAAGCRCGSFQPGRM